MELHKTKVTAKGTSGTARPMPPLGRSQQKIIHKLYGLFCWEHPKGGMGRAVQAALR